VNELDDVPTLLVDLHHLAEQALSVLRSREDFDEMADEYTPLALSSETTSAVNFVVGRQYDSIEWFALEVEPENRAVAQRFRWGGDQSLVPYFRVRYAGGDYTSRDMGLGEFCIHFLFWILEQYRECESLILLLDEPDAFLPPVGVVKLLERVMKACLDRTWRMIISTHSEEMISQARENDSFVLLRVEQDGHTSAVRSSEDSKAGVSLLSRPAIRIIVFCEDESAYALLRMILEVTAFQLSRQISIIWGDGNGYLNSLRKSMPRPPRPDVEFALVFDGDQRDSVKPSTGTQWPVYFLPTTDDPDKMFMRLSAQSGRLADGLGVPHGRLREFMDSLEGHDPHDWVNGLSDEYGRQVVLRQLALLWCELHPDEAERFLLELKAGLPVNLA
jgi:hypothetical protein